MLKYSKGNHKQGFRPMSVRTGKASKKHEKSVKIQTKINPKSMPKRRYRSTRAVVLRGKEVSPIARKAYILSQNLAKQKAR